MAAASATTTSSIPTSDKVSAATRKLKVLAIPGSLRKSSTNAGLCRYIEASHPVGMDVIVASTGDLPMFNADLFDSDGTPPPAVVKLRQQIEEADAIVLTVPEYNYSFSAAIGNAVDWAMPDTWRGKAVGLMSSGGYQGCSRAQLHLRQKFVFLEGHVMQRPEIMINQFTGVQFFDEEGNLTSDLWKGRIQEQLLALETYARTWIAGAEVLAAAKYTDAGAADAATSKKGACAKGLQSHAGDASRHEV